MKLRQYLDLVDVVVVDLFKIDDFRLYRDGSKLVINR